MRFFNYLEKSAALPYLLLKKKGRGGGGAGRTKGRKEVKESDGVSVKKAVIAVPRVSACLFIAWRLFFPFWKWTPDLPHVLKMFPCTEKQIHFHQ